MAAVAAGGEGSHDGGMAPTPHTAVTRFLALFALAILAGAQDEGVPTVAEVDALFAPWSGGDTPGAAVAVVRDGKVLVARGYGLANLEHRVPITPETVFDIASVSKQFTGLAVAMLVEEGKLSLDDAARKYLSELPEFDAPLTVGHLVHHTSGLRDWPGMFLLACKRLDDVIAFEEILDLAWHHRDLNFRPGSEHLYSNTGYNLLAEIVARVGGMPFAEWTERHLFAPLGMKDTHFRTDHLEVIPRRAYGYEPRAEGGFRVLPDGLTAQGSSSLFSTVRDLAKWAANFDEPRVGGPALARMHERGALNDGSAVDYAFGVVHGSYRGLAIVEHSGGWAGFRTHLLRVPQHRFAVIVLSNLSTFDPSGKARELTARFLAEHLAPPAAASAPAVAPVVEEEFAVERDDLEAYAGVYESEELDTSLMLILGDEGLVARQRRHGKIALAPVGADEFRTSAWWMSSVRFERDEEGRVGALLVTAGRVRNVRFVRR